MTYIEAIEILKSVKFTVPNRVNAEACTNARRKVMDALIKLDLIETHGCGVCKRSKEYDCKGCAYDGTEDWKEPCRICRRNCKDYYREAEKHENKNN